MTGLSKVFWGLLLVFVDIRLNNFDILPDLIGFIIAYTGFSQLSSFHPHFEKAKYASIPLLLFSILDLFQVQAQVEFSTAHPSSISLPIVFLSIVSTLLYLYMVFHLCKGIGYIGRLIGVLELEQKAQKRWTYFLWITLIMFAVPILALLGAVFSDILLLVIPLIIIGLIVYILILMLIRETDQIWRSTSLHE